MFYSWIIYVCFENENILLLVCDERETIECSFSHTNDEVITEVRSNSLLSISPRCLPIAKKCLQEVGVPGKPNSRCETRRKYTDWITHEKESTRRIITARCGKRCAFSDDTYIRETAFATAFSQDTFQNARDAILNSRWCPICGL